MQKISSRRLCLRTFNTSNKVKNLNPKPCHTAPPQPHGVAEPVVPEREQIPFLAETEGRGQEETPRPSGSASSAAGSRDLVEQVQPLHVDFLQLWQFIHRIRPRSGPYVRADRRWQRAGSGDEAIYYHLPARTVAVSKIAVPWHDAPFQT